MRTFSGPQASKIPSKPPGAANRYPPPQRMTGRAPSGGARLFCSGFGSRSSAVIATYSLVLFVCATTLFNVDDVLAQVTPTTSTSVTATATSTTTSSAPVGSSSSPTAAAPLPSFGCVCTRALPYPSICAPVVLAFHNTPWTSVFNSFLVDDSQHASRVTTTAGAVAAAASNIPYTSFIVVHNVPVATIVLDLVFNTQANATSSTASRSLAATNFLREGADIAYDIDSDPMLNMTVSLMNNSQPGLMTISSAAIINVRGGQYVVEGLIVQGPNGATGRLLFEVRGLGLSIFSGYFEVYVRPSKPTPTTTRTYLDWQPGSPFSLTFGSSSATRVPHLVVGKPLPTIVVAVVDAGGGLVTFYDGEFITVTASYVAAAVNASLGTAAPTQAVIANGVAVFPFITFPAGTVLDTAVALTFQGGGNQLKSPAMRTDRVHINNYELDFELRASYFPSRSLLPGRAGGGSQALSDSTGGSRVPFSDIPATVFAQEGKPMPRVIVRLLDSLLRPDHSTSGISVTAWCPNARLRGNVAVAQNGVAVFDSLTFVSRFVRTPVDRVTTHEIVFTGGVQNTWPVAGRQLLSPAINVSSVGALAKPVGMRFSEQSFLAVEGELGVQVTAKEIVRPIIVEIIDISGHVVANSGQPVLVSAVPDASLSGTSLLATNNGYAPFVDLALRPVGDVAVATLTFSSPYGTVTSGPIAILPRTARGASIAFESSHISYLQAAGQPAVALQSQALPTVVVNVLDSSGDIDLAANDVVVTATSSIFLVGAKSVSYRGRAMFSGLALGQAGQAPIVFTASSLLSPALNGATLTTGPVTCDASYIPLRFLAFDPRGHVRYPGHRASVAVSFAIPPFAVRVSSNRYQRPAGMAHGVLVIVAIATSGVLSSDRAAASSATVAPYSWIRTRFGDRTPYSIVDAQGIAWFNDTVLGGAPVDAVLQFRAFPVRAEVGKSLQEMVAGNAGASDTAPREGQQAQLTADERALLQDDLRAPIFGQVLESGLLQLVYSPQTPLDLFVVAPGQRGTPLKLYDPPPPNVSTTVGPSTTTTTPPPPTPGLNGSSTTTPSPTSPAAAVPEPVDVVITASNSGSLSGGAVGQIQFTPSARIGVQLALVAAGDVAVLPLTDEQAAVTVTSLSAVNTSRRAYDGKLGTGGYFRTVGSGTDTLGDPARATVATFTDLQLSEESYIVGAISAFTFTSSVSSMRRRVAPFVVGPMLNLVHRSDADDPVVVAEVLRNPYSFQPDAWMEALRDRMQVDRDRLELVRVRPGGTAVVGRQLEWLGTRVEIKILPPTTASVTKTTSQDLVNIFLSLTNRQVVAQKNGQPPSSNDQNCRVLDIRRVMVKSVNDTSSGPSSSNPTSTTSSPGTPSAPVMLISSSVCDVYRLEEQLVAAKRCVATSLASKRCDCHEGLFRVMGRPCQDVTALKSICSQLWRCRSALIEDVCAEFREELYVQYLRVFGYCVAAVATLVLLYMWRSGTIKRCQRARLGEESTRDTLAAPLKERLTFEDGL